MIACEDVTTWPEAILGIAALAALVGAVPLLIWAVGRVK